MCVPRVNGMITSNRSTRDVSVEEEKKKKRDNRGWGRVEGLKVAPERIESPIESERTRSREEEKE